VDFFVIEFFFFLTKLNMARAKKWTLDMIIKSQYIRNMLQETKTIMQGIITLSYLTLSITEQDACFCVDE
jgi:hypothetical protein